MGRRHPTDWVNWRLYRRAWIAVALAAVAVMATSFRPDTPPVTAQAPTFSDGDAAALAASARQFDRDFPDRRAGTPGALDSAQWVRQQFTELGLAARVVPGSTSLPGRTGSVGIVDVIAHLPGRTGETVVLLAPRDTLGPHAAGSDAGSTMALLALARELGTTHDRRRSYLFASTDAAAANDAGARVLAQHLAHTPGRVVAVIALREVAMPGGTLRVSLAPAGRHMPPLGLVALTREAAVAEGGSARMPGAIGQVLRMGVPVTRLEHGQLVTRSLPAITLTAGQERTQRTKPGIDRHGLGSAVRSVERALVTLDELDAVQSAGKTWAWGGDRAWRGWALKLLIASLLVPVWVAAMDMLVRYHRRWALVAASGTVARSLLAGIWAIATLWALAGLGVVGSSSDLPPDPSLVHPASAARLVPWLVFVVVGWLLARAPDWRRSHAGGRDHATLVVALLALCLLSALALAVNPFAVLFAVPALHAWLWLSSRRVWSPRSVLGVWLSGALGPVLACEVVAQSLDTGAGTAWYVLDLIALRGLAAPLMLLLAMGCAVGVIVLEAARDTVHTPLLRRMLHGRPLVRTAQPGTAGRTRLAALVASLDVSAIASRARSVRTSATTRRRSRRTPHASGATPAERAAQRAARRRAHATPGAHRRRQP